MWINHHLNFTLIRRTDHTLLVLNGLLLLGVTFLPFPTALAAGFLRPLAGLAICGLLAVYFALPTRYHCWFGRL